MLEIVCIKASFDNACVRCNGIFELYDLKCDSLLCEDRLCYFEDLRVRCDVCAYLDKAIEAGIRNTSFITMMPANRYCIDNYISLETFAVISDEQVRRFNETHESNISIWNRMRDHDHCRCLSGSYESAAGRTRFYFRCPGESRPSEYCRQLVYTPDNKLQDGFGLNRTVII